MSRVQGKSCRRAQKSYPQIGCRYRGVFRTPGDFSVPFMVKHAQSAANFTGLGRSKFLESGNLTNHTPQFETSRKAMTVCWSACRHAVLKQVHSPVYFAPEV